MARFKRYCFTTLVIGVVCIWFFIINPESLTLRRFVTPSRQITLDPGTFEMTMNNPDKYENATASRGNQTKASNQTTVAPAHAKENLRKERQKMAQNQKTNTISIEKKKQKDDKAPRKKPPSRKSSAADTKKNNINSDNYLLNRQIQEAREAIQQLIQNTSVTSSVPVLLVTYMRSGSSWLGEMLKQAKSSFYIFEPFQFFIEEGYYTSGLVCFYNDQCRQPIKDIESHHIIMKNLLQLYACDMEKLHPGVKQNMYSKMKYLCKQSQILKQNSTSSIVGKDLKKGNESVAVLLKTFRKKVVARESYLSVDTCMKNLTDICKKSKYRIVKAIRISMELVQTILDFIPHLKVIHLVRDPRAITNSRTHAAGMQMSKQTESHSKALCKEMHLDTKLAQLLIDRYPERVSMVVYEALASQPLDGAKFIYKFLNIPFDETIEKWIYKSTHADKNNGFYGTNRTNSTAVASQWRNETKFETVEIIQRHCKDVLDLLGYATFKSPEELKNLDIPAKLETETPGFA